MRQEEEIQELQAVDGDLLLNGQGEEVNPHGNVIAGGHLRADDHAVIVDSCDFAVRAVGTVLS